MVELTLTLLIHCKHTHSQSVFDKCKSEYWCFYSIILCNIMAFIYLFFFSDGTVFFFLFLLSGRHQLRESEGSWKVLWMTGQHQEFWLIAFFFFSFPVLCDQSVRDSLCFFHFCLNMLKNKSLQFWSLLAVFVDFFFLNHFISRYGGYRCWCTSPKRTSEVECDPQISCTHEMCFWTHKTQF